MWSDSGGTARLFQIAGPGLVADLALTGRILDADEALRHGIVSRVVPDAELDAAALEMARAIAKAPDFTVAMFLRTLRRMANPLVIATGVASPYFAPVMLAFFAAVLVSAPWLLYQACAFVAPGLYQREKKLAVPLLVSAVALFYARCAFAFFFVLPSVFGLLTKVTPEGVAMMTDLQAYLDFVLVIFLAFGASFELPVALVIRALLGWVTPQKLRESRGYAIVGVFVVAAVITPPDVVSQLMLAIPMVILYEVGIIAAGWVAPRRATSE